MQIWWWYDYMLVLKVRIVFLFNITIARYLTLKSKVPTLFRDTRFKIKWLENPRWKPLVRSEIRVILQALYLIDSCPFGSTPIGPPILDRDISQLALTIEDQCHGWSQKYIVIYSYHKTYWFLDIHKLKVVRTSDTHRHPEGASL